MQETFRKEKQKPQGLVPGWAGGEDRAGTSLELPEPHAPRSLCHQRPTARWERKQYTSLTVGVGGRENPPEKPWETALMAVRPQTKELGVQGCAEQVNSQAENILLQCQQRDMQRKTGIADSGDEGETQPRRGEGSERPGAQVRTGDPRTGFSAVTVQDQR